MRYREAVGLALRDGLRADDRLLVLGDIEYALPEGAGTSLEAEFGLERIRPTPISESAVVGMAVGAAMAGYRCVVHLAYADIAAVCFSSIVQTAAKIGSLTHGELRCPVVVRAPIGRFLRHGPMGNQVTASWFTNVPGLRVVLPASAQEAYWTLRQSLESDGPTVYLDDRSLGARLGEVTPERPSATWSLLRQGQDLTIIAAGRAVVVAEEAADRLADVGLSAAVLSLGVVHPLDREAILGSVARTRRAVIVQDEPPFGGYAPAVRCMLDELSPTMLVAPPRIVAAADTNLPYLDEQSYLPSPETVAACARQLLAGGQPQLEEASL